DLTESLRLQSGLVPALLARAAVLRAMGRFEASRARLRTSRDDIAQTLKENDLARAKGWFARSRVDFESVLLLEPGNSTARDGIQSLSLEIRNPLEVALETARSEADEANALLDETNYAFEALLAGKADDIDALQASLQAVRKQLDDAKKALQDANDKAAAEK